VGEVFLLFFFFLFFPQTSLLDEREEDHPGGIGGLGIYPFPLSPFFFFF